MQKYLEGPKPNLGIARRDMPQIRSFNREEFLAGLDARYENVTITAAELSPTQLEIHENIVAKMHTSADVSTKPIMFSNDWYILDGHHRWAMSLMMGQPAAPLNAIWIDLPIYKLIAAARRFAKVEYATEL